MYDWRKMTSEERTAAARERREQGRPKHSPAHRSSDRTSRYHVTAACYEHRPYIGASEARLAEFESELLACVAECLKREVQGEEPPEGGTPTDAQAGVPALAGRGSTGEPPEGGTPTEAQAGVPALAGAGRAEDASWCTGFSRPSGQHRLLAWAVLPNHYHLLVACSDIRGLLREVGRLHGRTAYLWNGEDGQRGRQVWCKAAETAMKSERHVCVTLNYIHHNPVKHGHCTKWQAWPHSSAAIWLESVGREAAEVFWCDYPVLEYGRSWDV